MPMLKTNVAVFEVDENLVPFEVLLPVGEAVTRTALWGSLFYAIVGQMSAKD